MDDLAAMLGEDLGDCLDCCLSDDIEPTQSEADQQNRKVLAARAKRQKRIERVLRSHPELAAELGKINIGRMFKAVATGGISELAKSRVGKAIATGGVSEIARAAKKAVKGAPKKIAATVKGEVNKVLGGVAKTAQHAAANLAGQASAGLSAAAHLGAHAGGGMPAEIKIRCIPCDGNTAVAGDVAKKVVPEMKRIQSLLDRMQLQTKATSEHNSKKKQKKWRKEVLSLLKQVAEKRCHA